MPILIRIPYLADSAKAQPLLDAVKYAAREMCVSEFLVAKTMTYWLERIAQHVAEGKQVYIPGFGMFSPTLHGRDKKSGGGYAEPRFVPSRPFRAEVRAVCSRAKAQRGYEIIGKYYKHHHASARTKDSHRVFTAMAAIRDRLTADAHRLGYDM